MSIKVVTEFMDVATVRTMVYVYNDDDELVEPTAVKVSIIEPDGPRSGAATATTADHLVDTTKSQFAAADVGKTIYNTTDKTSAVITEYTSSSDVTLDTDIMAEDENYEMYCIYDEDIVSDGKVEDGVYEHYYHENESSDAMEAGQWRGRVKVIDGSGDGAKISPGEFSFRVK